MELTDKEFGAYMGYSPSRLAKMRQMGQGPDYHKGAKSGRITYEPIDLADWLENRRREHEGEANFFQKKLIGLVGVVICKQEDAERQENLFDTPRRKRHGKSK